MANPTINDICQDIIDRVALLKRELLSEKAAHAQTKMKLETAETALATSPPPMEE